MAPKAITSLAGPMLRFMSFVLVMEIFVLGRPTVASGGA